MYARSRFVHRPHTVVDAGHAGVEVDHGGNDRTASRAASSGPGSAPAEEGGALTRTGDRHTVLHVASRPTAVSAVMWPTSWPTRSGGACASSLRARPTATSSRTSWPPAGCTWTGRPTARRAVLAPRGSAPGRLVRRSFDLVHLHCRRPGSPVGSRCAAAAADDLPTARLVVRRRHRKSFAGRRYGSAAPPGGRRSSSASATPSGFGVRPTGCEAIGESSATVSTSKPSRGVEAERTTARLELELDERSTVVCVGRLCRQKGQDILLDAWPAVLERVLDAHLLLVGDGPDAGALRRRAGNGIRLAGKRTDVPIWLAAADVVAVPRATTGCRSHCSRRWPAVGRRRERRGRCGRGAR